MALQELIGLEPISAIGAGRYERTCERKQPLLVEGAPFNNSRHLENWADADATYRDPSFASF